MNNLEIARKQIDDIDEKIKALFIERMQVVEKVLDYKIKNQLPVLDLNREQLLRSARMDKMSDLKYKKYYASFLDSMLEISKTFQKDYYE